MKLVSSLNIKGAVLDKNQLNSYLEQIASDHILQNSSDKNTYPILRLKENFEFITRTYHILSQHLKMNFLVHPAGEWILDNYYIIEEAYQEVIKNLSKSKYCKFLGLANGMYKGYARIYVLASEIVAYTDGQINEENLKGMLEAYQKKKTLNMDEIWNIGVFFQIALIEKIRNICEKIYYSQIQKYKAENIIERLVEKKSKDKLSFKIYGEYKEKLNQIEQMKYPFIEHLSYKLKKYGKNAIPYLAILEEQVNKLGTTTAEIIQKEHFDIALKKVSMGNCISSIKEVQRMNIIEIFENINGVEEILKKDPANVYEKMDYKTKEYYRGRIKYLAEKTKISEVYIAKKILNLAKQNMHEGEKEAHIGYYLIDKGINKLIESLEIKKKSIINNITKKVLDKNVINYITGIFLVSLILTILIGSLVYWKLKNIIVAIITSFFCYIPTAEIITQIVQYLLGKFVKPKLIPKMDYLNGIPKDRATIVVIPTIINNEEKAKELSKKLEVFYLANKSENLYFALLGDCTSEKRETIENDDKIIKAALEEIQNLNNKYNNFSFPKFHFIYRQRNWIDSENSFLGWERKRGLLMQFNEFVINCMNEKNSSFKMPFGKEFKVNTIKDCIENNKENVPNIKYIITLDADTDLVLNSGLELVAAMSHVLNTPVLNKEESVVIDGHALMQPRVGIHLEASRKSIFSKIFGGLGGTDSYTNAISDIYQDNFGEGIFTGKGIYDLQVFSKILKHAIPENTVLSHDLLEGNYLRCALVTDILLMDGYPSKYLSFISRQSRWIRGDWQIAMWLKKKVRNSKDEIKENPLSILSKFKIFDNLRRSILEINIVISVFIAILFKIINIKFNAKILLLVNIIAVFMPTILEILNHIVFKKEGQKKQKTFEKKIGNLRSKFFKGDFKLRFSST